MSKKFTLSVAPTFKTKVKIPIPGAQAAEIEFTFNHQTRDEFKDFGDNLTGREDMDVLKEILCGWGLDDAFNDENLDTLVQNYPGSARAIIFGFINEITAVARGN